MISMVKTKKIKASTVSTLSNQLFGESSSEEKKVSLTNTYNLPSDTESALIYLKNEFPVKAFKDQLPPTLLVHQVYSLLKDKTLVDKDINCLQLNGTLRIFKLGREETALVTIFTGDFADHVKRHCPLKPILDRFLNLVLPNIQDVSVDKVVLRDKFGLAEQEISFLVNNGLLVIRSSGSYWFSFPNAGEFMKVYLKGRKSILRTIRKCKFSEILQCELKKRNLEKSAILGMSYHIHDIIGAELVKCVQTTSGVLLRLNSK